MTSNNWFCYIFQEYKGVRKYDIMMGISKNMFNGYADCIKKHKRMGAVIIAGAANIPEAETSYVSSRATSIVNKLTFTGKKLEQVEQEIIDLFGKKSYKSLTCIDFNRL